MPALPYAQWRRLQHCRPRHEQTNEPDRVPNARRVTRVNPGPEIGPKLAGAAHARLRGNSVERPRARLGDRVSCAHGSTAYIAIACAAPYVSRVLSLHQAVLNAGVAD